MLADNQLLKLSLPSGDVVANETVGHEPHTGASSGSLAFSRDERTLYVLPRRTGPRGELVVLDTESMRERGRFPLEDGILFQKIAVGPKTGRLYLVGTRAGRSVPALRSQGSRREQSAVLSVVDPTSGRVVFGATLRRADRHDWWVMSVALSPDETRLYVSYHGTLTTGADWFTITDAGVTRCRARRQYEGVGCVSEAHGMVVPFEDGFVAATGWSTVLVVDGAGAVRKRWDIPLTRRHLMTIALDGERRLYVVGDCGQDGGGLSRVDLPEEVAVVLPQPEGAHVCGDTIGVGPGNLLVLAMQFSLTATPPGLLLVDGETGDVVEQVATDPEPTEVVVAR